MQFVATSHDQNPIFLSFSSLYSDCISNGRLQCRRGPSFWLFGTSFASVFTDPEVLLVQIHLSIIRKGQKGLLLRRK